MKRGLVICCLFAGFILVSSCKHNIITGSGEKATETKQVQSFTAVEIEAPVKANIKIDSSSPGSLTLSGYKNMIAYIKTEMRGSTLRIYVEPNVDFDADKDVTADISIPVFTGLNIKGSGEADVHGVLRSDFNLNLKGAGDVVIDNINSNNFVADMSGAGSLTVNGGTVRNAVYKVKGAGAVEAYGMVCDVARAELLGAGDMELNVTRKLDAEIKGAGSISYKGHPEIDKHVLGVGSLEDAN